MICGYETWTGIILSINSCILKKVPETVTIIPPRFQLKEAAVTLNGRVPSMVISYFFQHPIVLFFFE